MKKIKTETCIYITVIKWTATRWGGV